MEWFEGSIIEAIQTSKAKKAFFVVYIEGTDDASKTTTEVLDRPSVANNLKGKDFVSIKLKKDTPEHKQFAEIYKMVPVPSVFFIGNNGLASEVVVGNNESANVEARLLAAIQKCTSELHVESDLQSTVASASSSASSVAAAPGPSSVKVESTELPKESVETPQKAAAPPAPLEDRVEKAKQLVSQKNEEKKKEELEKEKLTERERRKIGQEMHKAKLSRQEQEMKEALEERKKDTLDNAAARKKILDQIAQDRKERQERERLRASAGTSPPTEQQAPSSGPSLSPPVNGDIARLQFRLPGGETRVHTFPGDTTLNQIRQFIDNNIVLPFREYQIATTFPRREFTWRDNEQDLRSLNLLPSSVLLILPLPGSSTVAQTSGWAKATIAFFWSLVGPLLTMRDYVSSLIWGGRATTGSASSSASSSSSTSVPTRGTGPSPSQPPFGRTTIRKRGNIHTLGSEDDSKKDDNNTWNGNSTQQM